MVSDLYRHPMRMAGWSGTVPGNGVTSRTSNGTSARPWACACVFKIDGNSSNQHIWNQGEGAGSTDDNIYLRVDSNQRLYFGWGRSGALNELYIGTISANTWTGVYVAHTGERLSGANATPNNLADCFDVRLMGAGDSFQSLGPNLSTDAGWNHSNSTTGGRMDRALAGDFTVGGRGSNRSFHGKVASMVVTTLRRDNTMPTEAEAKAMITDPVQWLTDHKVGQTYRRPNSGSDTSFPAFQLNNDWASWATQVWLMGDGTSDAYAKIRNQVYPADQNGTPLDMISMVSNDIETVNIPGLT